VEIFQKKSLILSSSTVQICTFGEVVNLFRLSSGMIYVDTFWLMIYVSK